MYYLCSENKDADQLRSYREADLRLCFRICKKPVFSRRGSYSYILQERQDDDDFQLITDDESESGSSKSSYSENSEESNSGSSDISKERVRPEKKARRDERRARRREQKERSCRSASIDPRILSQYLLVYVGQLLVCLFDFLLYVPVNSCGYVGTSPPILWDFYPMTPQALK